MSERIQIVWFGQPPNEQDLREAKNRNLEIHAVLPGQQVCFQYARGAVFWGTPPYLPEVASRLGSHIETALNHGLLLRVVVADSAAHDYIESKLKEKLNDSPLNEVVRIRIGSSGAHEIPEQMARHNPGQLAKDSLQILPACLTLPDEQRFLLQRAFHDCSSILLSALTGGKSGARAFLVNATLTASNAGPRPMPFFVKLDLAHKILAEQRCYQTYADNHIPWHLRPNLQSQRCLLGVEFGVLVGSFVENSQSLWEVVRIGNGDKFIHALFENTLLGWREQSASQALQQGSIVSALHDVFRYRKVTSRLIEAARQFGAVPEPQELWESLLNLPATSWRAAPMHGDMHGENVRVRGGDAIIIDLAKASIGPLCADLASLEVWLAFQAPPEEKERPSHESWCRAIDELYDQQHFIKPPLYCAQDKGVDWMFKSVRQIRMIAQSVCQTDAEYKTVLALYLLRFSSFEPNEECPDEDGFRRAYAYHTASKLICSLLPATYLVKEAA